MPPTRLSYPNPTGPKQANNPVPAFLSLRHVVSESMVRVHRIAPELARFHVSQMDLPELRFRVRSYALLRLGLPLALARPESAESQDQAGRDGGTTNLPPQRDSSAFPLRGRRGWCENAEAESELRGEGFCF
jgi:hypothetical protein